MNGMYGALEMNGRTAVKRSFLYDEPHQAVMGCNISEAALGMTVCRTMPNVIRFRSARCASDGNIEIAMDRGERTLHEFVVTTPFMARMRAVRGILCGLLRGLRAMHTRGIAHCDFKPANIILNGEEPTIIDIGSSRFVERARNGEETDVVCTYAFAAQEALESNPRPAYEHDAYSLGVVLHFIIYKAYVMGELASVRTREDALKLHKERGAVLPTDCPLGVDPEIFQAMCGLLCPDPAKRGRISDLAAQFIEATTPRRTPFDLILDRALPEEEARDKDVDWLFANALSPGSFPLAVSIRDRAGAVGELEMWACAMLAHMTLFPDTEVKRPRKGRPTLLFEDIIKRVNFELYSDTAEWVLWLEHGIEKPDPVMLRDAIKDAKGDTRLAVRLYIRKRPAPEGGESPDHKRVALSDDT
jgi:serine/threonine protein kinase